MDEGDPRVELIRAAKRTIRAGTEEIDATFASARGPLGKAVVRDLHRRVKDLRQTAESAEESFRDWTVELAGRGLDAAAERALYESLRADFEVEVAAIRLSMSRVADEVKRRQTSKAKACSTDAEPGDVEDGHPVPEQQADCARAASEGEQCSAGGSDGNDTYATPAASLPAPAPAPTPAPAPETAPAPEATSNGINGVKSKGSSASGASSWKAFATPSSASLPRKPGKSSLRSLEAMKTSHATVRGHLQEIASKEREVQAEQYQAVVSNKDVGLKKRPEAGARNIHPFMKYIVWVALCSLGYIVYHEARYLILSTSPSEVLHHDYTGLRRSSGEALPPGVHRLPN